MDFLAEYGFEVEYRHCAGNRAADYLSLVVPTGSPLASEYDEGELGSALDSASTKENPTIEPFPLDVGHHLQFLKIRVDDEKKRCSINRMAKKIMM